MKWRDFPKIDAHIHIIPDEVYAANPDSDDEFSFAKVSSYQKIMDQFNIRRAIIMPFNDPWLMSMDFTVDAAHQNLLNICKEDGRFSCFSDVDIRNTPENTCDQIQKALVHSEFCGIKLHPNNSGMNIDDEYNDIIADLAVNTNYPSLRVIYIPPDMESGLQVFTGEGISDRLTTFCIEMEKVAGIIDFVHHIGIFRRLDYRRKIKNSIIACKGFHPGIDFFP